MRETEAFLLLQDQCFNKFMNSSWHTLGSYSASLHSRPCSLHFGVFFPKSLRSVARQIWTTVHRTKNESVYTSVTHRSQPIQELVSTLRVSTSEIGSLYLCCRWVLRSSFHFMVLYKREMKTVVTQYNFIVHRFTIWGVTRFLSLK